ncbi:hypothetical protein RDI58_000549 [Solanum bulbocastanum]|uniref:Uncharacterized protein n=1 Tax=Solanum bulbocastanum TaxID=147425 RepID=A0AAN8UB62_SOLBU
MYSSMGRWSNESFSMLLKMLKEELLPNGADFPNSRLFAILGFLTTKLMLVLMIACYIGRRIAYLILAKFVVHQDGK